MSTKHAYYPVAAALEKALGDPLKEQTLFSLARQVKLDEAEAFPAEVCQFLYEWGLFDYFVPAQYGGKMPAFDAAIALIRVLARRDLTVAIALGQIYLGAIHIWIAGNDDQKQHIATAIRQNNAMAFALTERAHGADVLASDVQALATEDGYRLTGEKWLINNGTRGRCLTVFARTDPKGGSRGFSLFLVDKTELDPATFTHVPKIKTHGIRGADISGIRFEDSLLPANRCIGQPGAGLEISLQGLMVTRTLCAGISLGAADTALRTVLRFALERQLYSATVFAIPQVQKTLADSFADLLVADCMGLASARGLHVVPEQFSVWSAIVKYFVPTTVENLINNLAVVLGARYYLREEHLAGIFQKMLRDNAVVSLFDGSTVVNLSAICTQLPFLTSARQKSSTQKNSTTVDENACTRRNTIFSLAQPLPDFAPSRLTLFNRGQDDILLGMPAALAQIDQLQTTANCATEMIASIRALAQEIVEQISQLDQAVQTLMSTERSTAHRSPAMFDLAKQYCSLHAAATCLHIWLHNYVALDDFFAKGEWLVLALDRLLSPFQPQRQPIPPGLIANLAQEAARRYQSEQAFSILPFQFGFDE